MENSCISCIKDKNTGKCYDIKDKVAREEVTRLKGLINKINGVNTLKKVDVLPTTNIDTNTLYLLTQADGSCLEYLYIDNQWELVGNTAVKCKYYRYKIDAKYEETDATGQVTKTASVRIYAISSLKPMGNGSNLTAVVNTGFVSCTNQKYEDLTYTSMLMGLNSIGITDEEIKFTPLVKNRSTGEIKLYGTVTMPRKYTITNISTVEL